MNDALYIAATGLQTQQTHLATVANNLANAKTPGFKKTTMRFTDMVQAPRTTDEQTTTTARADALSMQGVAAGTPSILFTQGVLSATDSPLDLAIDGDGFIEVTLPYGTSAYTRGGAMTVNPDGLLATADGHPLKPGISVGDDLASLRIDQDGRVYVQSSQSAKTLEIGRLDTVVFTDTSELHSIGGGLYQTTDPQVRPLIGHPGDEGHGRIVQGASEASNVDMVSEMVDLMSAQRAYSLNVKAMQAADEATALLSELRR